MKKFSITLGIISIVILIGLTLFGNKVYTKLNEGSITITKVDSITMIQLRDSIINLLNTENDSLKTYIKGNKDTVFIVRNKIDTVQIDTMTR